MCKSFTLISALFLNVYCELQFLETLPQFAFLGVTPIDLTNIVRSNGGGCSFSSNRLECVVPNDKLEITKTQLTAQGVKFDAVEVYDGLTVSYFAEASAAKGIPNISLSSCSTAFLSYPKNKIDSHIMQLNDTICSDSPEDCSIKIEEPCDQNGDCISSQKSAMAKKNLVTDPIIRTMDSYKQLIATPANKSNKKALLAAFEKFLIAMEKDSFSPSPECSVTVAKCISDVVKRSASPAQYDKIVIYSKSDVNKVFDSCGP